MVVDHAWSMIMASVMIIDYRRSLFIPIIYELWLHNAMITVHSIFPLSWSEQPSPLLWEKQDHLRWRYSTVIHLEQLVYLAKWKDLNKGKIWTKRTWKNQKIRLNYCDGEDGRAVAFFYVRLRAFGAQAVRMYCCCAYVLLMICRIHQTPPLTN